MGLGAVALMAVLLTLAAPKAVRGVVATLVQVANTTANPIPNRDVDDPGRAELVTLACSASAGFGQLNCAAQIPSQCCESAPYFVPAGYRLVIQQMEANCQTPKGQSITQTSMELNTGGQFVYHQIPLLSEGSSFYPSGTTYTILANNLAGHFYADPGSIIQFDGNETDTTGNTGCFFNASGYLISYP
jgi:hypothetical protein